MKMKFPYETKAMAKVLKLVRPTTLKWNLTPVYMTLETSGEKPSRIEKKVFKEIEKLVSKFRYW